MPTAQRPAFAPRSAPQLPPGFRWIAVRPGAAPPVRGPRRHLGPTPRYFVVPRWGLADRVQEAPARAELPAVKGPSVATVRTTLFLTLLVLAATALVYVARYVLLVVNRNILLNSLVAGAADWIGVAASAAAIIALLTCAVVLIRWLIARRAAAFSYYALSEHRSGAALWAGCLLPFVNLLWAPVYVIELATVESLYSRLQRSVVLWWIAWVVSYIVSIFAIATSFATDSQGIANNTALMVFAYLFAAAAVASVTRVFEGFERKPVHRPAHRWVVVAPERQVAAASAAPVELDGQEPAA
jgi:Domain of unknown function (DUF4328)